MNWQRLKLLRSAARVARVHTLPPLHPQTVGEHTFGVLSILITIHHAITPQLFRAAVYHDAPEALTGDVPAPAKWKHRGIEEALREAEKKISQEFDLNEDLTDFEKRLLKYADIMELLMFSIEEVDTGNRRFAVMARNCITAMRKRGLTDVTPAALSLFDFVCMYYEKHYSSTMGEEVFNGWPEFR